MRGKKVADEVLRDMHRLFLEALRQREQDIIRFLAILGPALVGYIWLLKNYLKSDPDVFTIGTIGILFILFVGAWYSVALGYNYRYITMQIAKFDKRLKIKLYILKGWPREVENFRRCYCAPPEIIKVFWITFMLLIIGILISMCFVSTCNGNTCIVIIVGLILLLGALLSPLYYGCKLTKLCNKEGHNWNYN